MLHSEEAGEDACSQLAFSLYVMYVCMHVCISLYDPASWNSVILIQSRSSLRLNLSRNVLIGTPRRLFPW